MREIINIINSLRPIVYAFELTGVVCGLCMMCCWYFCFFRSYKLAVGLTQIITNVS